MIELLTDPEAWAALATLTLLEIVLGIDNLVFIAILTERLPRDQRLFAYRLGLGGAMVTRILLLLTLTWIMHLDEELFWSLSGRDLIMLAGGLFLIGKSAHEIYEKVEAEPLEDPKATAVAGGRGRLVSIVVQIMVMDIVFSLDSVITAVGMADDKLHVMVAAIVIAVIIMLIFAGGVGEFIGRHPSMKVLALSFMLLIGVLLVADGFDYDVPKGFVYASMGFALFIELVNMRVRTKQRRRTTPPTSSPS